MKTIRPYLPWTIRILVAILFLVSALAKLWPSPAFALGTFEAKQLFPLGFPCELAQHFSRLMIALEITLGFGLLQPHYLKKIIVPATIGLLAVFCIHLTYSILSDIGGNCGCFGELIPMTPSQALIKNIITIGLLVVLYRMLPKDREPSRFSYLALGYTVFALILYMIAPIEKCGTDEGAIPSAVIVPDEPVEDTTGTILIDSTGKTINVDPKTGGKAEEKVKDTSPKKVKSRYSQFVPDAIKLDEGKKILCFFAPGCDHCRATAKALTRMKKADPNFPKIYIIFMDEEANLIPDFFAAAGEQYSYQVADIVKFWGMIGSSNDVPGVAYLWNGNVRYFANGTDDNGPNPNMFTEKGLKAELDKVK